MENNISLLHFYTTKNCNPNGESDSTLPRYRASTQKAMVSHMSYKRRLRDYMQKVLDHSIYADYDSVRVKETLSKNDLYKAESKKQSAFSGSAGKTMADYLDAGNTVEDFENFKKDSRSFADYLTDTYIDVRLFGGINTTKGANVHLTGPVQFMAMNESMNKCQVEEHGITSVQPSNVSVSDGSGTMGSFAMIPYAIFKISGFISGIAAEKTKMTEDDLNILYQSMWNGINLTNTHSKNHMNSHTLFVVEYEGHNKMPYLEDLVTLNTKVDSESEISSYSDFELNIDNLIAAVNKDSSNIAKVKYHTVSNTIKSALASHSKFEKFDAGQII